MKRRHVLFTLLILAVVGVAVLLLLARATPQRNHPNQTARFQGYTNGTVGPVAAIFITNSPSGSIVQGWYAAGATAGLFTITNLEKVPITLYPFGRFYTKGQKPIDETTYLLDVQDVTGFNLKPGQSATFQVGVLSRPGPWRILLFYERDSGPSSPSSLIREIVLHRRDKYEIYSDWIVQ